MNMDKLDRLATYEELNAVNKDLTNIYKELSKQTDILEKPSGIADRLFVDLFGMIAIYLLMFFTCDITRSILTDEEFFGIKWLVFGPYYFFTNAPLMTRLWKSKKFLEDLADAKKDGGIEYDPSKTCTREGQIYRMACERDETHPHSHPLREKMGSGLDWLLRHTVGKHFGGLLGNATCEDQSTTIAQDCADNRLTRAWNCYLFICEQYRVGGQATDIDMPNLENSVQNQLMSGWDDKSKYAYQVYKDVYEALYDIGSTHSGSYQRPTNLNPTFDATNNYCINASFLFTTGLFARPNWWINGGGMTGQPPCYFQDNYTEHLLDYWD